MFQWYLEIDNSEQKKVDAFEIAIDYNLKMLPQNICKNEGLAKYIVKYISTKSYVNVMFAAIAQSNFQK